jgi:hypothetical protein
VIDDVITIRPLVRLLEVRQTSLDSEECALEIGRHHLIPVFSCKVLDLGLWKDAGVSTQNIDPAMNSRSSICSHLHVSDFGDVTGARTCDSPGATQLLGAAFRFFEVA